jgi:hypothetical protein
VPEKYAGKRVKCPNCEGTISISAAGRPSPEEPPPAEKAAAGPPAPDKPAAGRWYLQTDDGQQYGPVSREELNWWYAEGRIDASCQLLAEGWNQWKWADEVFPELAEVPTEAPQATTEAEHSPLVGIGEPVRPSQEEANPYVSPVEPSSGIDVAAGSGDGGGGITPGMRQALAQTRPWVLFLSVLGFLAAGLASIASLVYVAVSVGALGALGATGLILLVGALMMAGATVLYFFAAYHLFAYASAIAKFLRSRETRDLARALLAQKSFWRLVGMVTAVVIAIYLLLAVFFLALVGLPSTMG